MKVLLPAERDPERFNNTGIFHYNISYEYEAECSPPWIGGCIGWVRDLRLSVTVVGKSVDRSLKPFHE
jgi:hypothetical protein